MKANDKMGMLSGWYESEDGAVQFHVRTKEGQDMVDAIAKMFAADPDFGQTDMEVEYDGEDVTEQVYGIMNQVKFLTLMAEDLGDDQG